jgi:hypothetical protein
VSVPARAVTVLLGFLAVAAVAVFVVIHYFLGGPPVEDFASGVTPDSGATVHVTLQEDPQNTVSTHPDWVSYFIKSPQTGQWVHTTLFQVPAGSKVDITILGYDGCTPLRNPYWGRVTGTVGDVEYVNGKPTPVLDSWGACSVGHTFTMPGLNINVPVASPTTLAQNNNLCGTSPCTSGPHTVVTFSFMTPKTPGNYFWQCRIPCGLGYLDGFGGPMQTIGFMTGNMEVVS